MAEALQQAIDAGDLSAVKDLFNKHGPKLFNIYVNWDIPRRESAVHRAVNQNQTEIALYLLQQKKAYTQVMVKHQDFRGETALHRCGWCGRTEIARKLIKLGAKVNVSNALGLTPLHLASERGKIEVVELLIRHKANVNCKSNQGNTPLHRAVTSTHEAVVAALLRAGAEVDIQNHKGNRAGGKYTASELLNLTDARKNTKIAPSTPISKEPIKEQNQLRKSRERENRDEPVTQAVRYEVEAAKVPGIDMKYYEIQPDKVMYGAKLGEGGFGTVYEGTVAGQPVALKQLTSSHARVHENFRKELDVMCKLRHPNIVLLLGAVIQPDQLCLVMEICQGGSLTSLLKHRDLKVNEVVGIGRHIAMAMNWLHSRNPPILHLDLKPANILLSDLHSLHVKVSDFGLARPSISDSKAIVGTRRFMAPEMMRKLSVNEKADVYSFGVLLWQIYTRKKPFARYKTLKSAQEKAEFAEAVWNGYRPHISLTTPPLLANLINRCWSTDAACRPTFTQVIQWLDQVMLHNTFSDSAAQVFWDLTTSDLADITSIRWKNFKNALISTLDEDLDNNNSNICWKDISKILCDPNSSQSKLVRIERFSTLVNSFGSFYPTSAFVKRVYSLLHATFPTYSPTPEMEQCNYYYPFTERDTAIALLVGRPVGTFLVRNCSTSSEHVPFILSYVIEGGGIKHVNVMYDKHAQQYIINSIRSPAHASFESFISSEAVLNSFGLKYSTHEEAD